MVRVSFPSAVKLLSLRFIAAVSFAGYLLLAFWFPLLPHFNQHPLPDIRTFTPSIGQGLLYAAWLCILFGLYALAYRRLHDTGRLPGIKFILLTAVCFALPLLFTFPINATDVYRYFIRGRVSSIYHQSPFAAPPAAFPTDPFLPLAGEWAGATSPYGPVWELTATAVTAIVRSNLLAGLLTFKAIGLLLHLAIALLIWRLLQQTNAVRRVAYTLLWAWNPALLLAFVVNAHNDVFMLFWLLLGWWLVQQKQPVLGFMLMMLAPLTKPIGLLPLPLFFLSIWQNYPSRKSRGRFLFFSSVAGLLLAIMVFLPFGSPLDLVLRLVREASTGGGFSAAILIVLVGQSQGINLYQWVITIAPLLLGLGVLWLLWLTWRGRAAVRGTADIFMAYILQSLNFRIWYVTWLIPWLLLDKPHKNPDTQTTYRLHVGLWLLLTSQLSVLIYGHLRVYMLDENYTLAHIIGVPFTLALPLFLATQSAVRVK